MNIAMIRKFALILRKITLGHVVLKGVHQIYKSNGLITNEILSILLLRLDYELRIFQSV